MNPARWARAARPAIRRRRKAGRAPTAGIEREKVIFIHGGCGFDGGNFAIEPKPGETARKAAKSKLLAALRGGRRSPSA